MLTILTIVYAFNFMDRNVLAILMQSIKMDLQLTDSQIGVLTGIAFAFFYSTLGIPLARWADFGNRITIISITVALWSVMVIYCGLATTYLQMLLARVGVAVGEAGCVPPAQSLISDYYSRDERPRAMSHYMLGVPLSVIVGLVMGGWINELYGWRMAFFTIGVPGILLAIIVRFSLREPRLNNLLPRTAQREATVPTYGKVFRTLWRQLAYRHLAIGFTLIYLFSFGISQWTPAFLIRTFHIETGELGLWYAFIWGVGGLVGTYLGGYCAGRYAAKNERLQLRVMAGVLFGFIPLYIGIYLSASIYVAFFLMLIAAFMFTSIFGPIFAMIQGIVAPDMRAMSVAILLLFANLVGMGLGPIAVGVMSDLLKPVFGDDALRFALLMWTPGYLWAIFHLMRAEKYVQAEVAISRLNDSCGDLAAEKAR